MTPRELPAFDELVLKHREHAHALVIPVINEGERIRGQLRRVRDAALPVDVIVADGGSTDGSLDPAFLSTVGVTALLTKRGPGKLSAQLRMAYAWVLDQGYDGVVTVDGNGKDGVDAVSAFVAKLEDGYDYIQGSRYLPGGRADNTPLDRKLAGRLIHAPVLSMSGRAWYTDTTNGFRGYSAKYLQDPRVQPFRDVFDAYSLLFYLTVRAGQLGFRTCELPVSRSYPLGEAVPTKIGGLSGKLKLLGEMFAVAAGKYNP